MNEIYELLYKESNEALSHNDVPIGAVITKNRKIIASAHNTRELKNNILGHAEINCIREASKVLNTWNLKGCDIFVTLKPCSMCNEIIKEARIKNVYYILDSTKTINNNINYIQLDNPSIYAELYKKIIDFFKDKR